ncbi:MAG: hypothetical protein JWO38_2737 [Gemmataceae bacterium]|nr:hypothetical protein [Gemmataceae bacterium]
MRRYLGIDFGTSNTHVAHCTDGADGRLVPTPIKLGGKTSTATCVLWREPARSADDVVAYGTVAFQAWTLFEADERARHRFAFGFKPDLVRSETARGDALAFLRRVCADVAEVYPGAPTRDLVVVGVPAEIPQEHRDRTIEAVRGAGFARVECVDEPLGALAYHLNNGSLTLAQARQGVVVVDFGGGTLDVALVGADGLREPWGDPTLGGRLFDDLFFQWVRDQNAPLTLDVREGMVVWQKECRELKEDFSRRWKEMGDDMSSFKGRITVGDERKWLRGATVAEFEARARAYRPSPLVVDYFRAVGLPGPLASGEPIDLYDWIRRTLSRGRETGGVSGRFGKVVLTGGSSEWPFMRRLAAEVFGLDPDRDVIRSDDPDAAVGSGLALYVALKARHRHRREVLRSDLPGAQARFGAAVAGRLDRFADDAAVALLNALMPSVEAVFRDWYQNGGSLESVEARVVTLCDRFDPEARVLLEEHCRALDTDLVRLLRDHLRLFLREHAIAGDATLYVPESFSVLGIVGPLGSTGRFASAAADTASDVTAVTGVVVATVVAAIKIKLIVVAVTIHPWMGVLLAIGALLAYLGIKAGTQTVLERAVRQHQFNAVTLRLLHLTLWDAKFRRQLDECREEVRNKLREEIRSSLDESRDPGGNQLALAETAVSTFGRVVSRVIDDLGVLEQLQAGGNRLTSSHSE